MDAIFDTDLVGITSDFTWEDLPGGAFNSIGEDPLTGTRIFSSGSFAYCRHGPLQALERAPLPQAGAHGLVVCHLWISHVALLGFFNFVVRLRLMDRGRYSVELVQSYLAAE